jgi:hypothetical protein
LTRFAGETYSPRTALLGASASPGVGAREHPLPLPTSTTHIEYEKVLFPFIKGRAYATTLGWSYDKRIRDTGSYVKGVSCGMHPAVRCYYSPKVMYWLTGDPAFWPEGRDAGLAAPKQPRDGQIPDGGMIVKEMLPPPARRYDGMSEAEIETMMWLPTSPGSFNYPQAGFVMACVRCHSVAEEGDTFSSLRNSSGFSGDPVQFFCRRYLAGYPGRPAALRIYPRAGESELSRLEAELPPDMARLYGDQVVTTCLRCHGAMGKRQYDFDRGRGDEPWHPDATFSRDRFHVADQKHPHHAYGALARDGISCTACQGMVEEYKDLGDFLANSITGQYKAGPATEIYGPFADVVTKPMQVTLGAAPCLEWLNSKYQDEFGKTADSRSCQDCHMPKGYESPDGTVAIDQIQTKIAVLQDQEYPEADNRIPTAEHTVRFRKEGSRRHTFQGANVYLMELFRQFYDVLGVRLKDYETGVEGLHFAIDNYVHNARKNTATLELATVETAGQVIAADVKVTNLTGHRLPSGVGFRRLWIELLLIDSTTGRDRFIWASAPAKWGGRPRGQARRCLPRLSRPRIRTVWVTTRDTQTVRAPTSSATASPCRSVLTARSCGSRRRSIHRPGLPIPSAIGSPTFRRGRLGRLVVGFSTSPRT